MNSFAGCIGAGRKDNSVVVQLIERIIIYFIYAIQHT